MSKITDMEFFSKSALELAPMLLGKLLCTNINGETKKLRITETECYMGGDDLGCHASKGKTERNAPMFEKGGISYVYLVYGMHNMFNVISGKQGEPEGVLVRCCEGYNGPAKLTKFLGIDRSLNRKNLTCSDKIWLEDDGFTCGYVTKPRVGIDYAGEYWSKIEWRFVAESESL